MTGAEIPLILAMVGSTAVSAYTAIETGKQKSAALKHQAAQKEIQAQHVRDVAAANSRTAEFNQRKVAMAQTAEQYSLQRKSLRERGEATNRGLSIDVVDSLSIDDKEESALSLSDYSQKAYNIYSNNVNAVYTAGVESNRLKQGAEYDRFGAKQARRNAKMNAFGEVVSGAVSLYSTDLNYKASTGGSSIFGS